MRTEEEQSEIKVKSYKWKSGFMFVTGHYEFEINITTNSQKDKSLNNKKTIYRRFSEIEILHEGLIKYNPGSRIPQMPEKSIWCNVCVNMDQLLDKRKKQIEEYLNYINNHKYLNKNPIFLIFLCEDFEKYKNDQIKKEWVIEFKSIFVKKYKPKGDDSDFQLEFEKEKLIRLEKGISEAVKLLEEYIATNEEKSEALKNIFNSCKSLDRVNFNFDLSSNINSNMNLQKLNPEENAKENFNKNIEIFFNLYDKNKTYCTLLENNVLINLKRYQMEIISLKEIFDRKDKIEDDFRKLKNINESHKDASGFENIIENLYKQLYDELNFFKLNREKDLISILRNFFLEKYELDKEVCNVFEIEGKINNNEEYFNKKNEDIVKVDYIK